MIVPGTAASAMRAMSATTATCHDRRDRIGDLIAKKMTLEQVKAARPTFDYDGVYGSPAYTGDTFVEAVYRSLSAAPNPAQRSTSR
jgi:hypothetical protein